MSNPQLMLPYVLQQRTIGIPVDAILAEKNWFWI